MNDKPFLPPLANISIVQHFADFVQPPVFYYYSTRCLLLPPAVAAVAARTSLLLLLPCLAILGPCPYPCRRTPSLTSEMCLPTPIAGIPRVARSLSLAKYPQTVHRLHRHYNEPAWYCTTGRFQSIGIFKQAKTYFAGRTPGGVAAPPNTTSRANPADAAQSQIDSAYACSRPRMTGARC
jgi:hypothetical protein